MTDDAVFVHDGERYTATDIGLGPWDAGALHGGAPAALLAHVFAQHAPEGLRLARLTCEFVRPVPVDRPLEVRVEVVRPGRRVTLLDGTLHDGDTEVTRARALLLAPTLVDVGASEPPPFAGPQESAPSDWDQSRRMFVSHAVEIRFARGAFWDPGPATAWFRMAVPLIAGEPTLPFDAVAAVADFGNGTSSVVAWSDHVFINPDLTVHMEREPIGEWIGLEAVTRVIEGSTAVAEAVLWDETGRLGRAVQSLLVSRREG